MNQFGFNLNMRSSPEQIFALGKELLGSGKFHALEAAYTEHMAGTDTSSYNAAVKTIVREYCPQVLIHFPDFNLAEESIPLRAAIVNEFKNCCAYVSELGGKAIVVHGGKKLAIHVPVFHEDGSRHTREEIVSKTWKLSVDMMRELCHIAGEFGIWIYTENLSSDMLPGCCKDLVKYLAEVSCGNLGIVFDTGHSHAGGYSVSEDILIAGRLLKHLHLHDNHSTKDEHLAPGQGSIDWKEFMEALRSVQYDGIYMLELYRCRVDNFKCGRDWILGSI